MYQFTFEPLHLCFRRWLWFRIWIKILADRRIWQKRHVSADLHTPVHPTPGDDQLFEYDDDSDENDSNGFVVEEDGAIRDMQSEELGFLLASRKMRSGRKVTTTRKVLLWTLFFKM